MFSHEKEGAGEENLGELRDLFVPALIIYKVEGITSTLKGRSLSRCA